MADPVVLGIAFDKPSYAPGDLITATVTYRNPNPPGGYLVTAVATDLVTGETGSGAGTFAVTGSAAASPVSATLAGGRSGPWTKVSDDHVSTAVFTATAPGTPAPAAVVPYPAALAAGHPLVKEYLPADLLTWRYLPGTTTPVTNGGYPMSSAASPRHVSAAAGVLTLACTNPDDCGVIQSPAKFPTASGVIEARVRFSGNGAKAFADWSALWLYGDSWPANGEIDAVETQYGNSYVSYHYATGGGDTQASTDPWTYPVKKVQLSPENTAPLPVPPNIVPDAWTVVDIAFGRDAAAPNYYYADVYYNGALYCRIAGAYVTGAPMYLTAGAGYGAGTLGASQAPYDVPGNIQLSYIRVFA